MAFNVMTCGCEQDEDLAGRVSGISRRVSTRSVMTCTLSRYLAARLSLNGGKLDYLGDPGGQEKRSDEVYVRYEQYMHQILLSISSLCEIMFSRNLFCFNNPVILEYLKKAPGLGGIYL